MGRWEAWEKETQTVEYQAANGEIMLQYSTHFERKFFPFSQIDFLSTSMKKDLKIYLISF